MSVKKRRLRHLERLAILSAACFIWFFLFVRAWPIVSSYWKSEGEGKAQQHSDYQFTVAVLTVVLNAVTLVVLVFQAVIFREQAKIANRQRKLTKGQIAISKRQIELEERRFVIEHRPRLRMIQVWQTATDEGIHVHFSVVNTGALPAEIRLIQISFAIFLTGQQDASDGDVETGHISVDHRTLEQSNSTGYHHVFKTLIDPYSQRDDLSLCVFSGDIFYFPKGQTFPRFVLHFSREIEGRRPYFRRADDPEREYSL